MSSNMRIPKTCICCGETFIAKTTKTKYCSHACNKRYYKKKKRDEKIEQALEAEKAKVPDVTLLERISKKEFLSIKEAVVLIGVSERTFYRLMKDGVIKYSKIGRRTIIQRSAIENLFNPQL